MYAGGVLTANVGIIGLIRQLASDRCLPFFLTTKNETFQTNHWISFILLLALYDTLSYHFRYDQYVNVVLLDGWMDGWMDG